MPTPVLHRILIVDDAVEVALCFTRVLERYGFEVNYVTDGMEALALHRAARAEERPFTLLILDWAMPILSGLELACAIRASGDTVKIVFLTAYYDDADLSKATEVDAEVWGKPIDVQALSDNVRRVLNVT